MSISSSPFHRPLIIVSQASPTTCFMAPIVDRLLLKQCWVSERAPLSSITSRRHSCTTLPLPRTFAPSILTSKHFWSIVTIMSVLLCIARDFPVPDFVATLPHSNCWCRSIFPVVEFDHYVRWSLKKKCCYYHLKNEWSCHLRYSLSFHVFQNNIICCPRGWTPASWDIR